MGLSFTTPTYHRFLSSPFIIRVPFFMPFDFKKGTPMPKQKRAKGYYSGTQYHIQIYILTYESYYEA